MFSLTQNISIFYWLSCDSLTVWLTEDPWTEALCSPAGRDLCRGRGTRWVCESCLHTGDKTWTQRHHSLTSSFLSPFHQAFSSPTVWTTAYLTRPWLSCSTHGSLMISAPRSFAVCQWGGVGIRCLHCLCLTAPGSPPVAEDRMSSYMCCGVMLYVTKDGVDSVSTVRSPPRGYI